ncbi:hypothetical protein SC438_12455 [Legionella pneumophila]|uniref:hypothetical protein n=1 Tax=Legionella pneumophila TaxID=446 RepID=UPI00192A2183|nr:hypothetical protein [Legionella pneumophila]HCC3245383.1 hypothetical protein [Legionella pneumophila subsp. pneumophila]MCZ4806389.1 hypothetical protein [Legionella pneumophila]MDW9179454.1 hypothetical protein [Legionella pneumophila]HBD9320672.1 hypothetical protein [Legionella pneumophila]HBD9332886.1 hypothetical protein [Legionella pneumophila]
MAISKPYHRNCRQFTDGLYSEGGRWQYIVHPDYAKSPEQYIRAFLLIQKDLQELFDYIEPADKNLKCYSFRVHALLMRTCIETEANFKAVLNENGYENDKMDIDDYKKLEKTHKLSAYKVRLPHWIGQKSVRTPFSSWAKPEKYSPAWYQAYNKTKHNRHTEFHHATFENLIDSVCGLLVLLSSQFHTEEFSSAEPAIAFSGYGPKDGMESAIGGYFRVKFPDNWPQDERYDFKYSEWIDMAEKEELFQKIDYSKI